MAMPRVYRYRVKVILAGLGHVWVYCHAHNKESAWRRVRRHANRAHAKYGVDSWAVWLGFNWRHVGAVCRVKERVQ